MSNDKIGYDHLLERRVKQLREIDDQIQALMWRAPNHDAAWLQQNLQFIRTDIAQMIRVAQAESDAF